jgi:hypothetical protein
MKAFFTKNPKTNLKIKVLIVEVKTIWTYTNC